MVWLPTGGLVEPLPETVMVKVVISGGVVEKVARTLALPESATVVDAELEFAIDAFDDG